MHNTRLKMADKSRWPPMMAADLREKPLDVIVDEVDAPPSLALLEAVTRNAERVRSVAQSLLQM